MYLIINEHYIIRIPFSLFLFSIVLFTVYFFEFLYVLFEGSTLAELLILFVGFIF